MILILEMYQRLLLVLGENEITFGNVVKFRSYFQANQFLLLLRSSENHMLFRFNSIRREI